ncbi:MAG: porin family protein [Bacteroidales bacterium]
MFSAISWIDIVLFKANHKNKEQMRKFFLILASFLIVATTVNAQSGFGIKAGLNFNSMSDIKIKDLESSVKGKTGFHVGVLYKISLPFGLAVQPELLYSQKSSTVSTFNALGAAKKYESKVGYLQLPVNVQWGVDLVLLRPYLQVSPYIGYAVSTKTDYKNLDYKNFQYGIGVGAGIEVWKFQIIGRYCWDLGEVGTLKSWGDLKNTDLKTGKNRGFELSLAIIF